MRTIIVTVAVINVMGTWNDFLLPSLIINKQGLQTLPLKNISVLWTICKTLGFGFCRIGYVHGSYYYLLFV